LFILVVAILLLGAAPVAATPTSDRLREVEQELHGSESRSRELEEETARLKGELAQLQAQMILAAGRIRRQEALLFDIEAELDRLQSIEAEKLAKLARRRAGTAVTLAALTRVGLMPPQAVLFRPGAEIDRLRAASLLGSMVPEIEKRASGLRADLAALSEVRHERFTEHRAMAAALAALQGERKTLQDLHSEATDRRKETVEERAAEAARAKELAETARDLRALLTELQAQDTRRTPAPEKKYAALTNPATLPALGKIVRRFGETSAVGTKLKGLEIETRQEAQIVAPAGGRVVFAGPFRGYGLLLIIAETGGYHVLLSGFAKLDCEVGQIMVVSEPVGRMGGDGSKRPTLYMEVRRDGEPIDPLPWIASGERKVSG
jgi:septal ring factor EnvC (AmiA/AmiB activator)